MGEYLRWTAVVLAGVILILCLPRQSRELGVLVSLAVCVLVSAAALEFLEPVMELVRELRRIGNLGGEVVSILLKTALVGILCEIAGGVCTDTGEGALAKALQMLSNIVILWLSLPLLRQILTMIEGVLT